MYHYKLLGLGDGFDTLSSLATRPMTADHLQRRSAQNGIVHPYHTWSIKDIHSASAFQQVSREGF